MCFYWHAAITHYAVRMLTRVKVMCLFVCMSVMCEFMCHVFVCVYECQVCSLCGAGCKCYVSVYLRMSVY